MAHRCTSMIQNGPSMYRIKQAHPSMYRIFEKKKRDPLMYLAAWFCDPCLRHIPITTFVLSTPPPREWIITWCIDAEVFWWLVGPNQLVGGEVICWFYRHKHLRCSGLPGVERIPVNSCFWLNKGSKQPVKCCIYSWISLFFTTKYHLTKIILN